MIRQLGDAFLTSENRTLFPFNNRTLNDRLRELRTFGVILYGKLRTSQIWHLVRVDVGMSVNGARFAVPWWPL